MEYMNPYDCQLANEYSFNRKHIDKYIRTELFDDETVLAKVDEGVLLLEDWLSQEYFPQKAKRLEQVKLLDLKRVIKDIIVGTTYCQTFTLFTSITAQLASRLGFDDRKDAIQTVAEITAVIAQLDLYDIGKFTKSTSLMLKTRIRVSEELVSFINQSSYLPPLVCKPKTITRNYMSGYYTHQDSVILGAKNHHDECVSLDVINTQNSVELAIDADFVNTVEEVPTKPLESVEQQKQWNQFLIESAYFVDLINSQSDRFYLTYKVDMRGRLYAQGYHINTMGTPYKKAMINLFKEEIIDIPEEYK